MNGHALDAASARWLAQRIHAGGLDRSGLPVVEHVERVASAVPPDAAVVAYLHDALERTTMTREQLLEQGVSDDEADAIVLLTRDPAESYEIYALRIAYAPGRAGALARAVKLADLDDHIREPARTGAPPYAWARAHIRVCSGRYDRARSAA